MNGYSVVLCIFFFLNTLVLDRLAAATVSYNTVLESFAGSVSNVGTDAAGNIHAIGFFNAVQGVVSINPSGVVNWVWSPPASAGFTNSVPTFGADGSTYIAGFGSLGLSNSSTLFTGSISLPYFLAKIDASGNPVWAAYVGNYVPQAVAIDPAGNVYATGMMTTSGAPFTLKLNSAGNSVLYVNNSVGGSLIKVDAQGLAVIVSPISMMTSGPSAGTATNSVISGLDSQGNQRFSANFGGSDAGEVYAIQLDSADNIYLAGSVSGRNFPVTPNALQPAFPSLPVDPGALAPASGFCIPDFMFGGQTCTFPGSPSPVGPQLSGFLSVLNPDASSLIYSTYFGGSGTTLLSALTLDELNGRILLVGYTNASDTPGMTADSKCVPSIFATELALDGSSILPTVTLGFSVPENGIPAYFVPAMAELPSGVVAISYGDPDIALIDRTVSSPVACVANAPDLHPTREVAPGQLVTIFGSGLGSDAFAAMPINGQYPTASPDQVSATVNGIATPLLYTSPDQINLQIPYEIASAATATLIIHTNSGEEVSQDLRVIASNPTVFEVPVEPGECLTSWAGEMHTLAINADGTRNACDNPAQPGTVARFFMSGLGLTDGPQITGATIPVGATTTVSVNLRAPSPGGWTVVSTSPLIGSITGMYEVDLNVGTTGYDAVAYLGVNNTATASLVDIRVVPDATDLPK